MDLLIQEIERALEKDCLFAALSLSLVLPDLCSQLEYTEFQREGHVKERYVRWLVKHGFAEDRFITHPSGEEEITFFCPSADFIYSLRCSLFHTGGVDNKVTEGLERLVFVLEANNAGHQHLHDDLPDVLHHDERH